MSDVLRVDDLSTEFATGRHTGTRVVRGVGFSVPRGHAVGLVGETGSGKSVTVRSILGLIRPPGRVVGGTALFEGADLLRMRPRELRRIRGARIGFVAQNPFGALNPILPIGTQFRNALRAHRTVSRDEAIRIATDGLAAVGVAGPERVLAGYAHELSGGMAQRVVIALVMALDPALLIADEPTTALDLTVQRQVLDLISGLITSGGRSMLLITHDLGVVAQYCQRVVVMRSGEVVEHGPVMDVFTEPKHPYTRTLLESVPTGPSDPEPAR